jgi:putative endonuclease
MPASRSIFARLARWWQGPARAAGDPLGAKGEAEAEKFLVARGYQVIGRNLRFRRGEIDLLCIAPDERTVVLVEVKSRAQSRGVYRPEAAITSRKRRTLHALANQVRKSNNWDDRPVRIDVVAVELGGGEQSGGRIECRHYESVV